MITVPTSVTLSFCTISRCPCQCNK